VNILITIEIRWGDLTPEAQERITSQMEAGGIGTDHNWDIFPMAMIEIEE